MTKKPGRVLPRPSAVFYAYVSMDTPSVVRTLSHCTPVKQGKVSSNSLTHEATQFRDFICPTCDSTFQMLVHLDSIDVGINPHRQGLPFWSSEFMIQITLNFSIQYSSFFPNCIAWSHIKPFYQLFMFSTHSNHEAGYKSSKSHEWNLPLDFYWSSIH
jgi:hypothetical protein